MCDLTPFCLMEELIWMIIERCASVEGKLFYIIEGHAILFYFLVYITMETWIDNCTFNSSCVDDIFKIL